MITYKKYAAQLKAYDETTQSDKLRPTGCFCVNLVQGSREPVGRDWLWAGPNPGRKQRDTPTSARLKTHTGTGLLSTGPSGVASTAHGPGAEGSDFPEPRPA